MNILIIKTSAIGDVTHTLPALNAIRRRYPDAHIAWLVEEAAADLVVGQPALDRVLVSGRKRWLQELKGPKRLDAIRELFGFIRQVRDTEYDLLIDFQGLLKSSMWVALARAKRKVGFGRGMEHSEFSYLFLNERVPPVSMEVHAAERQLLLLKRLGMEAGKPKMDIPAEERHEREVDRLLKEAGLSGHTPLAVVNAVTTWPTKHWEDEKFAQVADGLLGRGWKVVFSGGPGDRERIEQIRASMRHQAYSAAGKTSLKTLAALFRRARVVITIDTGPMHIAAAVGTPVVALFGPTAPWRTGPVGDNHIIVREKLSCSPCYRKTCESVRCMRNISTERVLEAVEEISEGKTASSCRDAAEERKARHF